jgi:hypothetical protein
MLIAIGAAATAGMLGAIALAIIDLYMTGHGLGSLTRETITWEPGGIHMSVADVIFLVLVAVAFALAWVLAKGKRNG